MRNRILVAVILFLPPVLFVYFWLHPGAVKGPAAGENKNPQDAAARAPAPAAPQTTAVIASNFAAAPRPPIAPAGKPAPLEFTNVAR